MFRKLQRRLQRLEQTTEPLAAERDAGAVPMSPHERVRVVLLVLQRLFHGQAAETEEIERAMDYYSTASEIEAEAFLKAVGALTRNG
jgi:hypothetical protein